MARHEVAAGEGALRTQATRPFTPRRKSSTSEPSRSMAWALTPAGAGRTRGDGRDVRRHLANKLALGGRADSSPIPARQCRRSIRSVPGQLIAS